MKLTFEDGTYIEVQRSKSMGKIWVTVAAQNQNNPMEMLVNSAEVEVNAFQDLLKNETGPIIVPEQ